MAGWTDPDSSPTGTFTATRWNTYIRDNEEHLHDLLVLYALNNSGGSVADGAVVALETTADASFVTTTTGADTRLIGVALGAIGSGAHGYVALGGHVGTLLVTGMVTRGGALQTSTTAQRAAAGSTAPFATALTANPSGTGTVEAVLRPFASGLTDPLTTRGDLIVRAASTTTRLALGTNTYVLTSNGTDAVWAAPASSGTIDYATPAWLGTD